MINLTEQLEAIRPSLNLKPSPVEPTAKAPAPAQIFRIPAKVVRDGLAWSPTYWYNPKSNHDRSRAMSELRSALQYGTSLEGASASRWGVQIGDKTFTVNPVGLTEWINS
jgi:hypothetical protein